mmetsp:Transcript_28048/g.41426  ORF Transcript_28048/g.41426 Transcript_28048/m.41426 type:complete len:106 (+) Transcript_28048:719-1036(+)
MNDETEDMGEDMKTTTIDMTGEAIMSIVTAVVETIDATMTETTLATVIMLNIGDEDDIVTKGEDDDHPLLQVRGRVHFHAQSLLLDLLQNQDRGHDLSRVICSGR